VRRGRTDLVDELVRLGSPTDVSADDEALGAIARGERPDRVVELDASSCEVLVDAAIEGGAFETVVELYGVDLRGILGGTLLHNAAWHGRPDLARRLIELGADVQAQAPTEWSTPLGWAAIGSRYAVDEPGAPDHVAVAEVLVAAGARVEPKDAEMATGPLAEWLAGRVAS
jgi:hypothetical protein